MHVYSPKPCHKIDQGPPRVIICVNLVVLMHPMLHTKFHGNRPFGSGEEDFFRFLTYMGMAAILVKWPGPFEQTFVPPSKGGSTCNLASIGLVLPEKKMFENADNIHTYKWTTEAYLYYTKFYSITPKIAIMFLSFNILEWILEHSMKNASVVRISWNLAFCMHFTHAYTHKTFNMHVQLEKWFESEF